MVHADHQAKKKRYCDACQSAWMSLTIRPAQAARLREQDTAGSIAAIRFITAVSAMATTRYP
jgi:hypothetical protein